MINALRNLTKKFKAADALGTLMALLLLAFC